MVRRMVIPSLITLYRAPSHVETAEQGRLFQNEIIDAVARMRPTEAELEEVWASVKRTYTKATWPTPAVLCEALKKFRAGMPRVPKPEETLPPPDPEPMSDQERREYQALIDRMNANPDQYALGPKLIQLGEAYLAKDWRLRQRRHGSAA